MHPTVESVTRRITERSVQTRTRYLQRMQALRAQRPQRRTLSCGNLAHGFAACGKEDKHALKMMNQSNVGIVTAYNDMLSAHQPYAGYPDIIRTAARKMGCTAQVAGATPAMCDGITQGQPGMDLSLFSRDVIAMSTAIALSHQMFDAVMLLGICDKIVPGLLMGALSYGHLPAILVPAGPMPSGLPNKEKVRIRQLYAEGKVGQAELLEAESQSYHSAGTCTFYGTANSNQMLVEVMGLHLPGAAFVPPDTRLRLALTEAATEQVIRLSAPQGGQATLADMVNEKSLVNALVALLASGGSTNHTMHWVAIARAAGIVINWDDFAELSAVVPSLTRIYPNGQADINHFHAAGGTALFIRELLQGGFLHEDVMTVAGEGLTAYTRRPVLNEGKLTWHPVEETSGDETVLAPLTKAFSADGGLRVVSGSLGRGVIKVSAVDPEHWIVEAPARVFDSQDAMAQAFHRGELDQDCIVVVRFQGPKATGMPELHKLTPFLGVLQDRGYKVALVTDGRMSGASGKVPAAIHVYPEALEGGPLARVCDGDIIRLDARAGRLDLCVEAATVNARPPAQPDLSAEHIGYGRELFAWARERVTDPESGAVSIWSADV